MIREPNPNLAYAPMVSDVNSPACQPYLESSLVFAVLTTIVTFLRFVARHQSKLPLGLDDGFIIFALLCLWAMMVGIILGYGSGMGEHIDQLPWINIEVYLKGLLAYDLEYSACNWAVKMSIIYFYKRIFSINRKTRYALYAIEAFVTAWFVARILSDVFQCKPVSFFWNKVQEGHCVNQLALYTAHQVLNILTEVVLYIFPLPIIWKLHVDAPRKIGLSLVFMAGAFVIAVTILRTFKIRAILSSDFTYTQAVTGIYAVLEVSVAIMIASLPTISFLFRGSTGNIIAFTTRLGSRLNSSFNSTFRGTSKDQSESSTSSRWGRKSSANTLTTSGNSNMLSKGKLWPGNLSANRSGTYEANVQALSSVSSTDESNLEKGYGDGVIRVKQNFDVKDSNAK